MQKSQVMWTGAQQVGQPLRCSQQEESLTYTGQSAHCVRHPSARPFFSPDAPVADTAWLVRPAGPGFWPPVGPSGYPALICQQVLTVRILRDPGSRVLDLPLRSRRLGARHRGALEGGKQKNACPSRETKRTGDHHLATLRPTSA